MRDIILLENCEYSDDILTKKGERYFSQKTGLTVEEMDFIAFRSHPVLIWMAKLNGGMNPFINYSDFRFEEFDEEKFTPSIKFERISYTDILYETLELTKKVEKSTIKKLFDSCDYQGLIDYLTEQEVNITDS